MNKNIKTILKTALALAICPSALAQTSPPATAGIEEVIVTAQRREERLQDVPISITSLSAETLQQANVQQLGDIMKLSPAVRFDYNANFVQPTVRGIGTSVVTSGGGSNVGIYVDGFYSPNPLAADTELLNIEGVQILKGPQGTLFGRNTTGGAILVSTGEPSTETRTVVETGYSSFDTRSAKTYFTTGLTDNIAFDIAGSYRKSDGFVDNIVAGPENPGNSENLSIRTGLKIDLSEDASLLFRYTHHNVNDASNVAQGSLVQDGVAWAAGSGTLWQLPSSLVPTGYRDVAVPDSEPVDFQLETDIFQLTGTFELDFATLTSYTQYREDDTVTYLDEDETAVPIVGAYIPVLDETISQEFLLTSKADGPLQWTAGLFYFNYEDTFDPVDFSLSGGPFFKISGSSATTETIATYLDLTYELSEQLFLTVGGRYSQDSFGDAWVDVLDFSTFQMTRVEPDDIDDDRVTPRIVLRYEMDDSTSVYASYTQGYKAAITDLPRPGGPGEVDPETIDAYEIGYKYSSSEMTLSLASWYYDYQDLQVSSYPQGLAQVNNAATAEIYGLEGEVRYLITPDFDINAGAAWVDAKYDEFPNSARYATCTDYVACGAFYGLHATVPFDASGLNLQRAPEFSANIGARYGFDFAEGRVTLSANLYYTSKIYFDLSEQFYEDGYELLGLRAEWTDPAERYTFAIFGDNVTDSEYYSQININNYGAGTVWGAPASIGVSARANF